MSRKFPILFILAVISIFFFFTPFIVRADVLGQRADFYVSSGFDKYKRTNLPAALRYVSNSVYFYVSDSYWDSLDTSARSVLTNNINTLANEFESNIYPKEVSFWGSEPNPGIDGDPKMTILIEELNENSGGYFETSNGYPKTQFSKSNQREMFFINAVVISNNSEIASSFLAHEFQHLISFNQKELLQKATEDTWFSELRSEYSITRVGYNDVYSGSNLDRRARSFFQNPSDSLTEWPNNSIDYGIAAVFGEYMVDQFGTGILSETLKKPLAGINSLNEYLKSKNYYEKFEDVFIDWMAASYLNIFSENSKLGYKRPELQNQRVQPQQRLFLSPSLTEYSAVSNVKDWQPVWIEADVSQFAGDLGKSIKLELGGDSREVFVAGYVAFNNGVPGQLTRIKMSGGKGTVYVINNHGGLGKIILFVTKGTKVSGFGVSEYSSPLSIKFSAVSTDRAISGAIKDGDLIRKKGEGELYVVWGKYKRYLNPEIVSLYGHLNPADAIELESDVFNSYTSSNYVKFVNDEKVYAVWPDGTKHWLHITPKQWDDSHRDWNAIFVINDLEVNHYKIGEDIMR